MNEVDRLRRFVEALRVLAQTNDPNRVVLIEIAINEYLRGGEPGTSRLAFERICDAIDREEAEKRRGEDWSMRPTTHTVGVSYPMPPFIACGIM